MRTLLRRMGTPVLQSALRASCTWSWLISICFTHATLLAPSGKSPALQEHSVGFLIMLGMRCLWAVCCVLWRRLKAAQKLRCELPRAVRCERGATGLRSAALPLVCAQLHRRHSHAGIISLPSCCVRQCLRSSRFCLEPCCRVGKSVSGAGHGAPRAAAALAPPPHRPSPPTHPCVSQVC